MIWQLGKNDWPILGGRISVPVGTVLDGADWRWHGIDLPRPAPLNSICLDQESYNQMLIDYPNHHCLILTANPEIIRTGDF
jgi:hypothetical protein